MKKLIYFLPLDWLIGCANQQENNETKEVIIEKTIEMQPDSVLRHVVYFSFKETSSQEDIQSVIDAFRDLQNKIDGIKGFEWGINSSPENLHQGLTHALTASRLSG